MYGGQNVDVCNVEACNIHIYICVCIYIYIYIVDPRKSNTIRSKRRFDFQFVRISS
jgi:hypothetical protein